MQESAIRQLQQVGVVQTSRIAGRRPFVDLLSAAQKGEDWAWRSIYSTLLGPVTGYLSSRGAREPDDLAAEVFLQVARDIGRFSGEETAFRSWVFVIAHRRLIDARRAESRRVSTRDAYDGALESVAGGDVEAEAIDVLSADKVSEILDALTDAQRDVLTLRVVADLSIEETAQVMNKRPGAIKALQRRALAAVRSQLKEGRVSL